MDPSAVAIQEGSPEYRALKVLGRMGLEELSSETDPFIAQLVLTVVKVTGLSTTGGEFTHMPLGPSRFQIPAGSKL